MESLSDPPPVIRLPDGTYTYADQASSSVRRTAPHQGAETFRLSDGPGTAPEASQATDLRLSQKPKSCVHQGPPDPRWTPTPSVL